MTLKIRSDSLPRSETPAFLQLGFGDPADVILAEDGGLSIPGKYSKRLLGMI